MRTIAGTRPHRPPCDPLLAACRDAMARIDVWANSNPDGGQFLARHANDAANDLRKLGRELKTVVTEADQDNRRHGKGSSKTHRTPIDDIAYDADKQNARTVILDADDVRQAVAYARRLERIIADAPAVIVGQGDYARTWPANGKGGVA